MPRRQRGDRRSRFPARQLTTRPPPGTTSRQYFWTSVEHARQADWTVATFSTWRLHRSVTRSRLSTRQRTIRPDPGTILLQKRCRSGAQSDHACRNFPPWRWNDRPFPSGSLAEAVSGAASTTKANARGERDFAFIVLANSVSARLLKRRAPHTRRICRVARLARQAGA